MNMTLQYARSPKNERAYSEKPTSQRKHYTTVGMLAKEGVVFHHTFQGYLNKTYFTHLSKKFIISMFLWHKQIFNYGSLLST